MQRIQAALWALLTVIVSSQPPANVLDDIIKQLLRPGGLLDDPFGGLAGTDDLFRFSDDDTRHNLVIKNNEVASTPDQLKRPFGGFMTKLKPFSIFDPLALMPDLLLSSIESMPDVVISDKDCLVTIETRDLDADSMSVKVYTTGDSIQLEITKVSQQSFFHHPDGDDPDNVEGVNDTDLAEHNHQHEEKIHQHRSRLRGGATAMSSMTSIRRFAAPHDCDMTANSSKATIDKDGGKLLLKFPKKEEREDKLVVQKAEHITIQNGMTKTVDGEQNENHTNNQDEGQNNQKSSWWHSLMNLGAKTNDNTNNKKIPIPLVRYDEF